MGLDMYLNRKKFIGAKYEFRKITGNIEIYQNNKLIPIDFNKVCYIEESAGYWRKANAIHNWFVNNVQDGVDDCKEYYVDFEKLEDLLNTCKQVKETAIINEDKSLENKEDIENILPTKDGFFFGSINYDEWYMEDIDHTIEMLEEIIEDEKKLNEQEIYSDFYYCSSW